MTYAWFFVLHVTSNHAYVMTTIRHIHGTTLILYKRSMIRVFFFIFGATAPSWPGPCQSRVFWITHNDAPHSVGLQWTSDHPDTETTHNTHNRQTSMPLVGFETTISAVEWPQTYALDRAAYTTGGQALRLPGG